MVLIIKQPQKEAEALLPNMQFQSTMMQKELQLPSGNTYSILRACLEKGP